MLICAEDLGFVPKSVTKVLNELSIFNLKVQTMSDENTPFYKSEDASYKTVFTTSTHDSETFRLWWKNGGEAVQQFYNQELKQFGSKPEYLKSELMQKVLQQDLNSKASLVIFPIQDILAAIPDYQNYDLDSERINIPSVFPHFWRYRIPFTLENLISNENFNSFLKNLALNSKRL
jgi:4-alpha-glucanotransferase